MWKKSTMAKNVSESNIFSSFLYVCYVNDENPSTIRFGFVKYVKFISISRIIVTTIINPKIWSNSENVKNFVTFFGFHH